MRVAIYHSILWPKYKGVVFSRVHSAGEEKGILPSFIQIAETEEQHVGIANVDLSYHQYPFRLLFRGSYYDSSLIKRVSALARDLYKHPVDLVVIPGYHRAEYWAMLLICMLLGRKRAVFCDSTSQDRPKVAWRGLAKRWFFRFCNGFFCYGIRSKQYLMSYGVDESKISYRVQAAALPHGYDSDAVIRYYETHGGGTAEAPRYLYVGRLAREKGLEDLFAAFCIVLKSKPEACLDLVGSGPLTQSLQQRVREMKLEKSVSFLGSKDLDEISGLLMKSAALVLPSYSEPWGVVINESMSYGCPVVVSNACGCVPDLVLKDRTGYAFERGDVQQMATAMLAISEWSDRRTQVAKACLELISGYTPERSAAQILDGCIRIAASHR
jgi:glycosyltransferase involved in cell wall biosynthesis